MSKPLVLTIDIGTQSVRTGLFDKEGNIVALEKKPYDEPYFSTQPGYAEQNPKYYFDCIKETANKLTSSHSELLKDIIGVTLTCFRDTAVLLDKNYEVIRPSILWLDQRQAEGRKKLPLSSRAIFNLVGMKETVVLNRKRSMAVWYSENEPETMEKLFKYCPVSSYMNYLLTGEMKDSSSNCAGHYPIDFKNRRWYKSDNHLKGQIFGISLKYLPELVGEGDVIGHITEKASEITGIPAGLPLFACGSDKSCETLGLGVLDEETASISYGTACTVEITSKKYHDSELFLPSYPSCVPGFYNMEVQIYRGYWMLNWFIKEFGDHSTIERGIEKALLIEEMNQKMLDVPAGCDGLVLQPYWGPGLRRPLAKGAIIGFSDIHTREHLYRAIIEGIAYALREGLEGFQKKTKKNVKQIVISGGGSQSDAICQITADIFGIPVSRVQTYETTSLGAAICGFLAAKEFKDPFDAVNSMVHLTKTFKPDEKVHEEYNYLFKKAYLKMFPHLKDVYKDIKEYGKRRRIFSKQ